MHSNRLSRRSAGHAERAISPRLVHAGSTTRREDGRQAGERPATGHQTEGSENDMNEKSASRGPNLGLLLLIPAAVIIAKGAKRRRATWESGWGAPGDTGRGHGHHRRFGGEAGAQGRPEFRLPPRIEWMLDTWHTRAHQATESTEAPTVDQA
jgi:hypothetical protein